MPDIYNSIDNKKQHKNQAIENYKAYKEAKTKRFAAFESARVEKENERKQFLKEYYKIMDKRELTEREHGRLLNEAKNYYFGNALKGIYIGALEAATLTDDAIFLAENMVDSYISENGGYNAIMNKVKADTYCLAKIRRLVEDAAEEDVKNIEDGNKEIDDTDYVEFTPEAEDEKDTAEVSKDSQVTTANIEDIVAALNQAGMEVVKKDDADNFKESEPEDTSAEVEDTPADNTEEGAPDTATTEAPGDMDLPEKDDSNSAEEPKVEEEAPEEPSGAEEPPVEENKEDSAEEPDELSDDISNSDKIEEEEKKEAEAEKDQEENELDRDVDNAEEAEPEESEDDDTIDPNSVKVNDDEEESEDDELDDDLEGDEDAQLDSEEDGDEDIDDIDDDELDDDDVDIDGDGEDDIGDVDEPEPTVNVDPNKTMMDELENEKEVKDAVELIRTRVADAEEAFIKRNQEDKKQIDDLLSKISKNVATVEKISQDDEKAESAKKTVEESTMLYKQAINKIQQDKPMTIFDRMTRNISESIIKDPKTVNMFLNESGTPDFSLITETAKVMYAFLETLNTLQLESIDGSYIKGIIDNIK